MVSSSVFPSVVCLESRAAEDSAEHFCQALWVQPGSPGWRSETLEAQFEHSKTQSSFLFTGALTYINQERSQLL